MSNDIVDIAIIGGGVAGISLAWAMAEGAAARGAQRLLVLEAEDAPGYHASGRSAALFSETYGNDLVRALSSASGAVFREPPEDFADYALTRPRGALHLGTADQGAALDAEAETLSRLVPSVRRLDADQARAIVPVLAPHWFGAVLEPEALDIDTNGLLQGCLRGLRRRGGRLTTGARASALTRLAGGGWRIETGAGIVEAGVLVNAAGAWADVVAGRAGVAPIGLQPKRRTAFLFDAAGAPAVGDWPLTIDLDESFYFKPDSGRLMGSLADETPSAPCDAAPDDMDVAVAVDRIEQATTLQIRRVTHPWAGLRSFVSDKSPVLGFDAAVPDFFWCAGQGGYGFQTAPAMARLGAALLRGQGVPEDLAALGVTAGDLRPGRVQNIG